MKTRFLSHFEVLYLLEIISNMPTCRNPSFILTLPVTVASSERSFSKLNLVKNYLRLTMSQERLTSLAILSIENDLARQVNFDDVIDTYASEKARRMPLTCICLWLVD